jgi:hypothetical protein
VNALELRVPALPRVGETFEVGLVFEGDGSVRALSADLGYDPATVQPLEVGDGELLLAQGAPHVTLSGRPGSVDVALLGAGLTGRGTLAKVRFRVVGAGEAKIGLERVRARDADNRELVLGRGVAAAEVPAATGLSSAMPTPFRSETTFELALARGGPVTLALYGVDGRRIRTLVSEERPAGMYRVAWDGRDDDGRAVAAGLYFARLITAELRTTRTVVCVR